MSVVDETALESLTEAVLQAIGRGEDIPHAAVALLLRRYASTGGAGVQEAAEQALTRVLDEIPAGRHDTPEWLIVLTEAAALSADERLAHAVARVGAVLRSTWPSRGPVGPAMRTVEACLRAAPLVPSNTRSLLAEGVDELERLVGATYVPGEGLSSSIGRVEGPRGTLEDQASGAGALLAATGATGRLSYGMLAEELAQFACRQWWDDTLGGFRGDFLANCQATRVLCQLAVLRADGGYLQAALVAPHADYPARARRALDTLAQEAPRHGIGAANYGLALLDWLAFARGLQ
jgi:hypothetical protein